MRITMYELYGKIYDENPPKHIKVYGEDWYWNDYDGYVTKESLKTTPDAQIYLMDRYRTFMNLNKEVKIIEEPKKIEKLNWDKNDFTYPEGNLMSEETADMLIEMQDKINNIIDILDKGENK